MAGTPGKDSTKEVECTCDTLGKCVHKKAILRAFNHNLELLQGVLLDAGCGQQPYKQLALAGGRVTKYIGLDYKAGAGGLYKKITPDIYWEDGKIPLKNEVVNSILCKEVLEHCSDPEHILGELYRVLAPKGVLFFTVPFLWPLHDVPFDEYRYTPFALERHLKTAGFTNISLSAMGGWDASLAQLLGLWVHRRPMAKIWRILLSRLFYPIIHILLKSDKPPAQFIESSMITGISGTAIKPDLGKKSGKNND